MTEAEWLACTDSPSMLAFLRDSASDRKLRLFACAWLRHVWHLLSDTRSRWAVVVAERYADGRADASTLSQACDEAHQAVQERRAKFLASGMGTGDGPAFEAACAAHWSAVGDAIEAAEQQVLWHVLPEQYLIQAGLIHELFGNPFRPIHVLPVWLTWNNFAVCNNAKAFYYEDVFDRMPILADALEDAGCDSADM
jgi:hypothetical protein